MFTWKQFHSFGAHLWTFSGQIKAGCMEGLFPGSRDEVFHGVYSVSHWCGHFASQLEGTGRSPDPAPPNPFRWFTCRPLWVSSHPHADQYRTVYLKGVLCRFLVLFLCALFLLWHLGLHTVDILICLHTQFSVRESGVCLVTSDISRQETKAVRWLTPFVYSLSLKDLYISSPEF